VSSPDTLADTVENLLRVAIPWPGETTVVETDGLPDVWRPKTLEEFVAATHIGGPQADAMFKAVASQVAEALAERARLTSTPQAVSAIPDGWKLVQPQMVALESGPEPSLREMVRSFYNRHAVINPDAVTEQYFAALAASPECPQAASAEVHACGVCKGLRRIMMAPSTTQLGGEVPCPNCGKDGVWFTTPITTTTQNTGRVDSAVPAHAPIGAGEGRTDAEIVEQANDLAREFYARRGYEVPGGYRFDRATHPHEVEAWDMACLAIEHLTDTDAQSAAEEMDEPAATPLGNADADHSGSGDVGVIPEGMKPWAGGDAAPEDWDGGPVHYANGITARPLDDGDWQRPAETPLIAYTPKGAVMTAPTVSLRAALQLARDLVMCIEQRSYDNHWWVNADDPEMAVCTTLEALDAALAQPAPPTEATEARAREVLAFLRGAGPLEGMWWGERPAGEPAYWWRKHLAVLAPTEATPPQDGVREARRTIEILSRALAWHGDPQRMATTREEWQQEIDAAIAWVKANPEPDRLSFSTFAALSNEVQP